MQSNSPVMERAPYREVLAAVPPHAGTPTALPCPFADGKWSAPLWESASAREALSRAKRVLKRK